MTWLSILLSLAALGGADTSARKCTATNSLAVAAYTPAAKQACKRQAAKKKKKKAPAKPTRPGAGTPATPTPAPRPEAPASGGQAPEATATPKPAPTPTPTATPVATPTPAPPGTWPTRTNVDLTDIREWSVRPSYRTLAAGPIDFNVNNRGEDDHNLTVRDGTRDLGKLDLAPGEVGTLTVTLGLGTYTLYCSLPTHETAGMRATIIVR